MEMGKVFLDQISIGDRLREFDEAKLGPLMESITKLGLQYPISVWAEPDAETALLVTGRHRLEAARRLGWQEIDCIFVYLDDIDRSLWEISENLHRAELSVQERADHIAEWIRLTEVKHLQSAQCAPIESKRADGRGHRQPAGINDAVRSLGIERTEAQRAVKIAGIAPDARKVADEGGLTTQAARLEIARGETPEKQVEIARNLSVARAKKPDETKPFIDEEKERAAKYIAELLSDLPYDQHAAISAALQLVAKEVAKHFTVMNGAVFDNTRAA